MRPFVALLVLAVLPIVAAGPAAAAEYLWSLSASTTDPFVNTAAPGELLFEVQLWLACSSEGLAAAELDVHSDELDIVAFVPCCGFLNTGGPYPECPLLAAGGCPSGPIRAGTFWVIDPLLQGGKICIVPCSVTGNNVTVDCDVSMPSVHPNSFIGFANDGSEPCRTGDCPPVAVESESWGRIKNGYR